MKKISLILIIWLISGVGMAHAVDQYTLLEPLPCIDGVSANCTPGTLQKEIDINNYFLYIYKFAIAASVFLAIVMIIWGGFQYITSEIPFIKSDGKSKITNAVSGLAMVLVSYLILQTIDPRLVNIDANLPAIKSNEEDIKAYTRYQNRLAEEFKMISIEDQTKFRESAEKIKSIEQEKAALDEKINKGEIEPQEATRQRAVLESKLVEEKSNRIVMLAFNDGITSYARAISYLSATGDEYDNLQQYTAQVETNTITAETNTPNVIINRYNLKMNELRRLNVSADKIQTLERQSAFFISQIRDSVEVNDKIRGPEKSVSLVTYIVPATYLIPEKKEEITPYLNEKLKEYEKKIEISKVESANLGIPEERYKDIFLAKINTIKNVLENK